MIPNDASDDGGNGAEESALELPTIIRWTADDFEFIVFVCEAMSGGVGGDDEYRLSRMAVKAEVTATALRTSDG